MRLSGALYVLPMRFRGAKVRTFSDVAKFFLLKPLFRPAGA